MSKFHETKIMWTIGMKSLLKTSSYLRSNLKKSVTRVSSWVDLSLSIISSVFLILYKTKNYNYMKIY